MEKSAEIYVFAAGKRKATAIYPGGSALWRLGNPMQERGFDPTVCPSLLSWCLHLPSFKPRCFCEVWFHLIPLPSIMQCWNRAVHIPCRWFDFKWHGIQVLCAGQTLTYTGSLYWFWLHISSIACASCLTCQRFDYRWHWPQFQSYQTSSKKPGTQSPTWFAILPR